MNRNFQHLGLIVISFTCSLSAQAWRAGQPMPMPPPCTEKSDAAPTMKVPLFTYYMPGRGGINGSCEGGASRNRGFFACKDTLDKFASGNALYIHTAAQQHGPSSALFGCWARTDGFDSDKRNITINAKNACPMMAIADHYARSEDKKAAKLDVELDSGSKWTKHFRTYPQTVVECVKRLPGFTNREKTNGPRLIMREPAAVTAVTEIAPVDDSNRMQTYAELQEALKNGSFYSSSQADKPIEPAKPAKPDPSVVNFIDLYQRSHQP